jgi:hypothetical protein
MQQEKENNVAFLKLPPAETATGGSGGRDGLFPQIQQAEEPILVGEKGNVVLSN